MRKTSMWAVILTMCLTAGLSVAATVRVDDFESYITGEVDTVTTTWKAGPTAATVIAEDAGNQVIQIKENAGGTGQKAVYGILSSNASIPDGAAGTLFFKYKVTSALDCSFGMTNLDTPLLGGTTWNDFRIQIANVNGALSARDGGTTRPCLWASNSQAVSITAGQWYYMWVVITNAAGATTADNYKIYLNQTGNAATEADRLKHSAGDTFVFRTTIAEALDRIYWRAQNSTSDLYMMVDNMYITSGTALFNPAIFTAHTPTPGPGAIDIQTNSTLSWYTGVDPANTANPNPNITKHYLYMRQGDPNLKYITPVEVSSGYPTVNASASEPVTLVMDKTYYWRVDESVKNSLPAEPNTIRGELWSFSTQKSIPIITQQPTEKRAAVGASVDLSVQFTSISSPTVTWKKYVDGVNDQTISSGVSTTQTAGVWTSTLTFSSLSISNEGQYYCLLANAGTGTTPVQSNKAAVIANRLLAQYKFENNLTDEVGGINGVGKNADPNNASSVPVFVTDSAEGTYAVSLDGLGQYVDFGTQAFPRASAIANGIGAGMDTGTITCWVKVTVPNAILTNYNDGNTTGFACSITTASNGRINVRGESAAGAGQDVGTVEGRPSTAFNMVGDGQWHQLTTTWAQGTAVTVYIDGTQVANAAGGTPERFVSWQRGVLMGATRTAADRNVLSTTYYGGLVDNLRIYNYRMTPETIAQEYFDKTGVRSCINPTFVGSVYNYDNTGTSYCRIDLADFVKFAEGWLTNGLFPVP